jgi:hypothetical protein
LSCSFSPGAITPGSGTVASTLTISSASVTGMSFPQRGQSIPIYGSWLLSFGIAGFAFIGNTTRRRSAKGIALFALLALGMFTVSCGGGKTGTQSVAAPAPSSYSVTILGNSSSTQFSTAVNITVQ